MTMMMKKSMKMKKSQKLKRIEIKIHALYIALKYSLLLNIREISMNILMNIFKLYSINNIK